MANGRAQVSGWGLVAALILAGLLLYFLQAVLLPFVVAAAVAYVASPLVTWLETRSHLPRFFVVLLLYVVGLGSLAALGDWLWPQVAGGIGGVAVDIPRAITRFTTEFLGGEEVTVLGQTVRASAVAQYLTQRMQAFFASEAGLVEIAGAAAATAFGTLITLVAAFYLLLDETWLTRGVLRMAPPSRRAWLQSVLEQMDDVLGRYLRGILIIVVVTAVLAWVGLQFLFHLPGAGLIAIAVGFLELIPVVGPLASGVITSIAAFGKGGVTLVLEAMAYYTALRLIIDEGVGPQVLGRAVFVHPVLIIFAFLAGGALFGILGVVLAIPAVAVLHVIVDNMYGSPAEGQDRPE